MKRDYFIFGEITGETARDFVEFYKTLKANEPLTIHLNSAGGEIFSALSIYNLIKNRAGVEIRVEGLAASAATLICCGGKVTAAKNSIFMLHLPLVGLDSFYNENELTKIQQSLTAIKSALIETYSDKLKMNAAEIEKLLVSEKWQSAEEAKKLGLVDEIDDTEVEMNVDKFRQIFNVNGLAFKIKNSSMLKLIPLEGKKMENTEMSESNKQILSKYRNSILTAEKLRVAALLTLLEPSPMLEIIKNAVEKDSTIDDIKPFINLAQENKKPGAQVEPQIKNLDELYKMLKDNLTSGAAGVSAPPPEPTDEEKKAAKAQTFANYLNEALGLFQSSLTVSKARNNNILK